MKNVNMPDRGNDRGKDVGLISNSESYQLRLYLNNRFCQRLVETKLTPKKDVKRSYLVNLTGKSS